MTDALLVRAPDHLGDGVLALTPIHALRPAIIVGPAWAKSLYADLGARFCAPDTPWPRADVAVLFKPALRAALRAWRTPRRIGLNADLQWPLLTDVVHAGRRHRLDDYVALVASAGIAIADPLPRYAAPQGGAFHEAGSVLLLPGTASGETVRWRGFRSLANRLGERAVFTGGPGEEALLTQIAGPHRILPTLPLPDFARLAVEVSAVVGNDSGLTHFAAAARRDAGRDPADVHVVCGSTDPARTAAPGATHHHGPRPSCWPCYRKRCPFQAPCLDAAVEPIVEALR